MTVRRDLRSDRLRQGRHRGYRLEEKRGHGIAEYLSPREAQEAAKQQAGEIVSALPGISGGAEALTQLSRLFARSGDNLVEASLLRPTRMSASASVGPETRLVKRGGIVFGLDQDEAGVTLFWRDGSLTVLEELAPACLQLIQRGRFRMGALPGAATLEQKIAWARDLLDLSVVRLGRQSEAAAETQADAAKTNTLEGWLPTACNAETGLVTWRFSNGDALAEPFSPIRATLRGEVSGQIRAADGALGAAGSELATAAGRFHRSYFAVRVHAGFERDASARASWWWLLYQARSARLMKPGRRPTMSP